MKMQMERGTVLDNLSGVARVMNYRIDEEDTGMVMDIIANRTYSQKQLAVVREYICNAWDAHVEAGNQDKPFEVTVPTFFEPTFKVRDYGQGLSVEDVERIYMRVAKSTKRNSNSVIGAYGIGSKAAFCYSDSFIITSWHNGICSKYVSQINAQKQAQGLHLSSEPSNEPSGIEIQVAVKPDDAKLFKDLILDVCSMFPVQPKILGVSDEIPKLHKGISGSCWYLTEDAATPTYSHNIVAVCGYVKYNVDLSNLRIPFDGVRVEGLHLEFGLGEVDIPPSRETLEYTQKTLDAIESKLKVYWTEIVDSIQSKINDCKNIADALKLFPTWGNRNQFMYKGHNLLKYATATNVQNGTTWKTLVSINNRLSKSGVSRYLELCKETTAIVVEDSVHAESKSKALLQEFKKVFIIPSLEAAKEFVILDLLPPERVFYSSKMVKPKISRESHNKGSVAPNFFRVYAEDSYGRNHVSISPMDKPTGKAVFLEVKGSKLVDNVGAEEVKWLKKMCGDTPLLAVRSKIVPTLDKSNWTSAKDFIKTISQIMAHSVTQEMIDIEKRNRNGIAEFHLGFLNHTAVKEIAEEIALHKSIMEMNRSWYVVTSLSGKMSLGIKNPFCRDRVDSNESIENKILNFFEKYPLLKFANSYQNRNGLDNATVSDMIEYIKSKEQ